MASSDSQAMVRNLTEALECPCCSQLMASPLVFTTCGHSFCSVCIKRWLLSKPSCPVCNAPQEESRLVVSISLSKAIDVLKDETSGERNKRVKQDSTEKLSKMPTIVYHALRDDNLDDLLKSVNLPTTGTRASKIALHREYTLAYNAEVDAGAHSIDATKIKKSVLSSKSSEGAANFFQSYAKSSASTFKIAAAGQKHDKALRRQIRLARASERMKFTGHLVSAHWRAVFSDLLDKPVYFNVVTNECTTERPVAIEIENRDDHEGDVIVIAENKG